MSKSLAIIVAAAAGFIGGILLAPKSGKDTREDLMSKKDDIQDRAKKSLETFKSSAAEVQDEVKASVRDVKEIAKK